MSGHSKWSSIKHKKGAADAKRGKIFTKLIREITTAARIGGGDPEANSRLRVAIVQAKAENMPKDNIEKAIKKGTSSGEGGENYEEHTYEGYGPGGTAVIVLALTDNKKRTTAEVRHIFSRLNGNLAEPGAVAWQFSKKGLITFEKGGVDEDRLMELALEAGAEDISDGGDEFEVYADLASFEKVKKVLDEGRHEICVGRSHHGSSDYGQAGRETCRDHAQAHGIPGRLRRRSERVCKFRHLGRGAREAELRARLLFHF